MVSKKVKAHIKIKDILLDIEQRDPHLIHEETDLKDVIEAVTQLSNDRMHYIVDKKNRLLGTISLDELIRHIFSHSHEPKIHPRRLMDMVISETAKHIMKRQQISAACEDNVEDTLHRMVKHHVQQIAIVDKENRVINDISMLDLLKVWLKKTNVI